MFLNNEAEESSDSDYNTANDQEEIELLPSQINIAQAIDREDDVLEQTEEQSVAPEPILLEELNISEPALIKFDTDEFYNEMLKEQYGNDVLSKAISICSMHDCYLDDALIIRKFIGAGIVQSEESAL